MRQRILLLAAGLLISGCPAGARHESARQAPPASSTVRTPAVITPVGTASATPSAPAVHTDPRPLEPCPAPRAEPSNDSPSQIVDDLSELYQACLVDFLDAYGETDQGVAALPPAQQRRALCAALGTQGNQAFERARIGQKFEPHEPELCVGEQKQELHLGRFIWEFSKLPNGKYLATRTARTGSPMGLMYQGHAIDTSLDGHFVVTVVASDAWRCPRKPEDPCDSFEDENSSPGSAQVRCISDQTTPCSEAGVTSEVYVTDYLTRATAYFGAFYRRPRPTIRIAAQQINVSAGDCSQAASLPLVAAQH